MRIIVTGIAGFIGHRAALKLCGEGHEVLGIDNLNDYYSPALKNARLENLREHASFLFEKLSLESLAELEAVFASFRPEAVLHLAAQAGVRYSLENPHVYIRTNVAGTMNVLECCRNYGKPRLVYASSSSVYGGNTKLPFSEDDRIDHPVSLYAATKKANELMAHTYSHLYGLPTTGLRFFTVYGPWGRPDMAMWLFTDAIMAGRPIKVFNHGDMFRDFTYIDDIVQGVVASLTMEKSERYEIFNLGNHRCEKLETLIGLIEETLGKKAEKIMLPMQDGDVKATYADIAKARKYLGFEPRTGLAEGVPRFIDWFRRHPEYHGQNPA